MNRRCIRVRLLQRRHEHVLPGLGAGQPVVFNHGWPLSSDAFEDQMFYLASNGYRCMAVDRTGRGRSDNATAMRSSKIVMDAVLKVYPGYPHGMPQTHKDVINADLLAFVQGKELVATTAKGA